MSILNSLTSFLTRLVHIILAPMPVPVLASPVLLVRPRNPATVHAKHGDDDSARVSINQWVEESCPSLKVGMNSSWWLPNGHIQTAYAVTGNFSKIDKISYTRQLLRLPDGGTIGLDFTPPGSNISNLSISKKKSSNSESFSIDRDRPNDVNESQLPEDAPTVIVAHGLTGGSHESYVRNVLEWVIRPASEGGLGGRGVVVNYRGCASNPVTSPQLYSAAYTGDYHTAVQYISHHFPSSPLIGVGFSLGASVLSRYMGEQGKFLKLRAGVVLGCPWDIPAMSITLEEGWFSSRVYSKAMAKNLLRVGALAEMQLSSPKATAELQSLPAKYSALRNKRSLRLKDVDEHLTSQLGGLRKDHLNKNIARKGVFPFEGAQGYYNWASSSKFVDGVKRPLLAVNAFDDPIVSGGSLPINEVQASSHVVLGITSKGGHLGWFNGPFFSKPKQNRYPQKRWIVQPISEFIVAALKMTPEFPIASTEVEEGEEELKRIAGDYPELEGDWKWVKGSEGDTYGRVGWMEVEGGGKVEGIEGEGAGGEVLQGL